MIGLLPRDAVAAEIGAAREASSRRRSWRRTRPRKSLHLVDVRAFGALHRRAAPAGGGRRTPPRSRPTRSRSTAAIPSRWGEPSRTRTSTGSTSTPTTHTRPRTGRAGRSRVEDEAGRHHRRSRLRDGQLARLAEVRCDRGSPRVLPRAEAGSCSLSATEQTTNASFAIRKIGGASTPRGAAALSPTSTASLRSTRAARASLRTCSPRSSASRRRSNPTSRRGLHGRPRGTALTSAARRG